MVTYKLRKLNVVKIVDSEYKRDKLIANGFELVGTKSVVVGEDEISSVEVTENAIEIADLTVAKLKEILDDKGIEYPKSADKKALYDLYEANIGSAEDE